MSSLRTLIDKHLRRALVTALALLALLSLAIAIYPEPLARPVVPASGLVIDSGFIHNDLPKDYELRRSILTSSQLAIWRSWTPEHGAVPADAHSLPFHMPAYLVVPYTGFAGDPGLRIYVECIANGATLAVANARTNTQWSEAMVVRPHGWCAGDARLRVHSDSHDKYIGFGTPFRISTIAYLKSQFLGLFAFYLVLFAAVAGLCLAASAAATRWWPRSDPLAAGFIGMGIGGYAMFFAFYDSHFVGKRVAYLLLLLALAGYWRWMKAASDGEWAKTWRAPLFAWFLVSLAYALLLFSADNGAGAWLANARFAPVRWSTDNQLPMLIAEYLTRFDLAKLDLGVWQVSDRTPLSYGLHAWLRIPTLWIARGNDGAHLAPQVHALIGILLNTAWVPVLTHILRRLQLSPRTTAIALATAALLPFCLFNSIYAWPKLLGGAFGLLALWLLVVERREPGEGSGTTRWLLASLLSALALLSHGGTVFGLLAMLALAFVLVPWPRIRTLLGSGIAGVALLVPWLLWQRMVQPHGNALMKSVFAGTYGFDERNVGVLDTIARSYGAIGFSDWWGMKLDALKSLSLPANAKTCAMGEMADSVNALGHWRIVDFISLAPSIKFLWLGLLAFATATAARRALPAWRPACLLLGAGALGVAADALLAWDCQVIHTQSYQSILAIVAGLLVLLLKFANRRLGLGVAALSIAYGLLVWVVDPLRHAIRIDPLALSLLALLVLGGLYAGRRLADDPGAHER